MKAVIRLDVPDWQIGQEVKVYFPDTMCVKGICENEKNRGIISIAEGGRIMITLEDIKRLKPCPICGNSAPTFYHYAGAYRVTCGRYNCNLKYCIIAPSKEAAISAWNDSCHKEEKSCEK